LRRHVRLWAEGYLCF